MKIVKRTPVTHPESLWAHRGRHVLASVYKDSDDQDAWILNGVEYGIFQLTDDEWIISVTYKVDEADHLDFGPYPTMEAALVTATLLDES